jgi:hypothetical protein
MIYTTVNLVIKIEINKNGFEQAHSFLSDIVLNLNQTKKVNPIYRNLNYFKQDITTQNLKWK